MSVEKHHFANENDRKMKGRPRDDSTNEMKGRPWRHIDQRQGRRSSSPYH